MSQMNKLGSMPVGQLLFNMSFPACSGILVMMLYNVIDTVFVGRYAGSMAIAGLSVVLPVGMLLPAVGMAIGVGSSSIISRSSGQKIMHWHSGLLVMPSPWLQSYVQRCL